MVDVTSLFEQALGSPLPASNNLAPVGYVDGATNDVGLDQPYTADTILNPGSPLDVVSRDTGRAQYDADATDVRSTAEAIGDSTLGIINGAFQGALGVGAAGAGLIDKDAGVAVSEFANDVNLNQFQSDALAARRRAQAVRSTILGEHNRKLRDREVADGSSEFMADLRRVGRDFMDGLTNGDADGMTLGDTVSTGVGSLLLGGVMGKAMKALGSAAMPTSIAALEGGGAYQQAVSEVMMMTHDQLMEGSPEYLKMIQSGIDPAEARREIANNAGLLAGMIQAPIGAATGKLVSKFEAAPFARSSIPTLLGNVAKEGIEEGIQSASGQLAVNEGIDTFANRDADMLSGVGYAAAEGGLAGSLTAGIGAPSAIAGSTIDAAKAVAGLGKKAVSKGWNALLARGDQFIAQNEAESPVSKQNVDAAVEGVRADVASNPAVFDELELDLASQVDDEADQNEIGDHLQRVKAAIVLDPAEAEVETNPVVKAMVGASSDRFEAIRRMSSVALDEQVEPMDRLAAGLYVFRAATQYQELFDKQPAALSKLAKDDPAVQQLEAFSDIAAAIRQDSELRQVVELAAIHAGELQPDQIETPEQAAVAAEAIDAFPDKATPDVLNKVLFHADSLPEDRQLRLDFTAARLEAEQELQGEAARLRKDPAVVSQEVLNTQNEKNKLPSAHQHMNRVLSALRERNSEKAKVYLEEFMEFARHMNNKVAAYNENFQAGKGSKDHVTQYEQRTPNGWRMTKGEQGVWVNGKTGGSVANAQMVEANAKAVVTLANRMANSLRDLGVKPIEFVQLDEALRGDVNEVVIRNRQAANKARAEAREAAKPAEVTAQPAREQAESEVAPVEATDAPDAVPAVETAEAPKVAEHSTKAEPAKEPVAKVEKVETKVEQVPEKTEETQVEEPAIEPDTTVAEVEKVEPKANPTTVAEAFPNLYSIPGKIKNWFHEAFKLPKTVRSRILTETNLGQSVYEALGSKAAFDAFVGGDSDIGLSPDTAAAYQEYFTKFNEIQDALKERLQLFLKNQKVGDSTAYDALLDGIDGDESQQVNSWVLTRALNIVEQQGEEFAYNDKLLDGVVLAAMDWLVSAQSTQRPMSHDDVAKATGVTPDETLVQFFNSGVWTTQAKRTLSTKIRQFWGVQKNDDAPLGYADGIPEAMAIEALMGLEAAGLIKFQQLKFADKSYSNLTVQLNKEVKTELAKLPDAIGRLVNIEHEEVYFLGSPPKQVAKYQMRNELVETTAQQKQVIKVAQETPHYFNEPMLNLYRALGVSQLQKWFGGGTYDKATTNEQHAASIDGKNLTVAMGLDNLGGIIGQARAQLGDGQLSELPVHFRYGISRAGRLHMLGGANPQADKLVREAILPTWDTVDLTDDNSLSLFKLAIGQHLGIKVHKQLRAKTVADVDAMLDGDLKPVIELLQELDSKTRALTSDEARLVEQAVATAGMDLTPGSLHALLDYARYQNATDKTAFRTALYIEADGITDGAINAMNHMSVAGFTPNWVSVMQKGGLFLFDNGQAGMSFNQFSQEDKVDLYEVTSVNLETLAGNDLLLDTHADGTKRNRDQRTALLYAMSKLLGAKKIEFDATTNELKINRGLTKNPLTVTLYGAGAEGIAKSLVEELTKAVYAKLSEGPLDQDLSDALNVLMTTSINPEARDGDNVIYMTQPSGGKAIDFTKPVSIRFKFGPAETNSMVENMMTLMVTPMRQAINGAIGDAMQGMEDVAAAVQVQSIFLKQAFQQYVQEALDAKEANPPVGWKRHDFLSQNELDQIYVKLSHLAPHIETETQSYMIASTNKGEISKTLPDGKVSKHGGFARSLFKHDVVGDMASPGQIIMPGEAGRRGMTTMVQGPGDGQMVQNLMVSPGVPNVLPVFDGINMGLGSIEDGSVLLNKAVLDAWLMNPYADVSKSYGEFLENIDLTTITPEMHKPLARALFPEFEGNAKARNALTTQQLIDRMNLLGAKMKQRSLFVQARHNVMGQIDGLSVDHMAAAEKPYIQKGKLKLAGRDPVELSAQLNELAREEYDRIKDDAEAAKSRPVSENLTAGLAGLGAVQSETGVRVASIRELNLGLRRLAIPGEHKTLIADAIKGLALSNYQVTFGSLEDIQAQRALDGLEPLTFDMTRTIHGFTVPSEQRVYVITPSSETLAHELIHAATLDKVVNYYNDPSTLYPAQRDAIARIEAMMQQWRETPLGAKADQSLALAHSRAMAEVENRLARGEKALALNEFMAWNLANRQLIEKGKQTPVLVKIGKAVIDAIKALIWGNAKAPAVNDDFFSNLRFNSQVLIYSAPTVQAQLEGLIAFQATENAGAKGNDRLTDLRLAFAGMMGRWVRDSEGLYGIDASQTISDSVREADRVGAAFATAFRLNKAEGRTFETMVLAMMTQAEVNPNALTRMQTLYRHVIDQLTVEQFMTDPENNEPNDRYRAQEKLNTLLGHHTSGKDMMGRSSLLPGFMALSMVSEEFRDVLAKLDLPKSAKDESGTLDAYLDNFGAKMMAELDRTMSGEGKQHNVRAALDALVHKIMQSAVAEQSAAEVLLNQGVTVIGKANQTLAESLSKGAHTVYEALDKAQKDAVNDWHKKVLEVGKAIASIANQDDAAAIRDGMVAGAMEIKVREISELVYEVVGRTEHNALVFDMIKIVRAAIQRGRQQYREQLPKLIASKFSRELTDGEYQAMYRGLAKTDIASLFGTYSMDKLLKMLAKPGQVDKEIAKLEARLKDGNPELGELWIEKAKQLSAWMTDGTKTRNLLRNATAISRLYSERLTKEQQKAPEATSAQIKAIDHLVTFYNLQNTKEEIRDTLGNLATEEADGMEFLISNLIGQYNDEQAKVARSNMAEINHFKGHVITENDGGSSLIVAKDSETARLRTLGYERVGEYVGSDAEHAGVRRSYFFAPVTSRAPFSQGIMQNVRMTASGVDPKTGYSTDQTAGLIDDPFWVKRIIQAMRADPNANTGNEALLPVHDEAGNIVAFERSLDSQQLDRLDLNEHMGEVMGVWRGRQLEELRSQRYNLQLVANLASQWDQDRLSKPEQYVDLFAKETLKDPVIRDAVNLFTPEAHDMIRAYFPDGKFMVQKDMVNNVIGYRNPSVGDLWTGVSRWTPEVRSQAVRVATGILGKDAFTKLMKAEKVYQTFITDARVTIVVKSVVVPAANILSNMVHLLSLNVPPQDIWRGFTRKAAEVDAFLKGRLEKDRIEAELRAAESKRDLPKVNQLKVQLQSILDNNRRLSIWPLIERGEFASISDAGVSHEEIELTEGRLSAYLEKLTEKLPPQLRTMARYGMVAKDTSLFKGLQRAVEYGDFLAKAVLYDDLTKRQKLDQKAALGRITEEFIHYDYLPGRTRTGLDNFGLTWFWNYKLRAIKVALNTVRNNPLSVVLAGLVPVPDMFGSIGTPVGDNIVTIAANGDLGWSTGIDQGLHAHLLNPWVNWAT